MVINIRGTSGSGKTTAVRGVMEHFRFDPIQDRAGRVLGHLCSHPPLLILGKYDETPSGGCDVLPHYARAQETLRALILEFHPHLHILLEGLMPRSFQPYLEVAQVVKSAGYLYAAMFLTTPLDECIRRVEMRRRQSGNPRPVDFSNTVRIYQNIENQKGRWARAGICEYHLSDARAVRQITKWLREGASWEKPLRQLRQS